MTTESTENTTDRQSEEFLHNAQVVLAYAEILHQLLQSERFQEFFHLNYVVHKEVDEDNKSVEITVIENPPEVVQALIAKKVKALKEMEPKIQIVQPSVAEQIVKNAASKGRKKR
jgi:hypothetical protein